MLESSRIYAFFMLLWDRLRQYYAHSALSRAASAVTGFIMRVWDGSVLRRVLLGDFALERGFQNSGAGRAAVGLSRGAGRVSGALSPILANSAVLRYLGKIFDNLLYISCAAYGVCLLVFGLPLAVASQVQDRSLMLFVGIAAAALGLVLILINKSLAALYNGSAAARFAGGFFGMEGELPERAYPKRHFALFGVLGLLLAVLACVLDTTWFVMAAGAIIGGALVLYRTEIGVFAAVFLIPLAPTKLVLGLCAVTVLSFFFKVFLTGSKRLAFNAIDLFILLFAAVLAYSVGISYSMSSSAVVAAVYLLFILFYFAVKNAVDSREKLFAVFGLIALSGVLVGLYGVYQKLAGVFVVTDAWLDSEMFDESMARIYSTLDNPNVLGEYLIFVIILAFGMLYYQKKGVYKLAGLGVLGITGLCMIYTQSRGAWLGLIFAVAVFVLLYDRKLIWLAVAGLLFMPLLLPESIIARFTSIGDLTDSSTSYRVNIWMASLLVIKAFWPSGIGLGTDAFMFIYHKYAYNAIYAPHSHNLYLQIVIDLGVTGIFVFVMYMACFFKGLLRGTAMARDKFLKIAAAVICAGMAGYLLQGLTDNVWYNYRVVCFFWTMMALGASTANMLRAGGDGKDSREENI